MSERFYDNLQGFSDLKYVNGILYGRLNGGEYQVIPTEGNPGEDGTDGVNAYLYIAYASDDQGTAFSLIPAANLKYIALLQSTTVISSPLASMFAGKWFQYLGNDGEDGADGVDGNDGLDAYVYVAYASDTSGTAFNMTPSDSLKYRAEIHVSTPIASPSLSDFSGATWVKYIGNDGQNLVTSVNSKTGAVELDAEDVSAEPSGAVSTHNTANDAHADLFAGKVDKITGKGLSTEDYTSDEKTKLSGIEAGAEVNVNADWNATSGDAQILNKPTIPTKTSDLTNDSDFTTSSAVSSGYVAKDGSKVLSDNNYDSTSKTKLDGLANITAIGDNLTLINGTLAATGSASVPPGCVLPFAGAGSVPSGFLLCNGAAVSRTTYADLFTAIGTTYGVGDGSTTFNIPDFRGRFLRGYDGTRSAAIGTAQSDGLPNIQGTLGYGRGSSLTAAGRIDGAVVSDSGITRDYNALGTASSAVTGGATYINASAYNSIYGNSSYVTPYNYAVQYIIKY